jgi:hypothetical protein
MWKRAYTAVVLTPRDFSVSGSDFLTFRLHTRCTLLSQRPDKSEISRRPFCLHYLISAQFLGLHAILGCLVLLGLLVQVALGAQNHRIYVVNKKHTWMAQYHRFNGRILLGVGIWNVAMYVNLNTGRRNVFEY